MEGPVAESAPQPTEYAGGSFMRLYYGAALCHRVRHDGRTEIRDQYTHPLLLAASSSDEARGMATRLVLTKYPGASLDVIGMEPIPDAMLAKDARVTSLTDPSPVTKHPTHRSVRCKHCQDLFFKEAVVHGECPGCRGLDEKGE